MKDCIEYYVCTDCAFAIAYDDYTGIDSDDREAEVRAAVSRMGDCISVGVNNGFSYQPCDCCRTHLGGQRYVCHK